MSNLPGKKEQYLLTMAIIPVRMSNLFLCMYVLFQNCDHAFSTQCLNIRCLSSASSMAYTAILQHQSSVGRDICVYVSVMSVCVWDQALIWTWSSYQPDSSRPVPYRVNMSIATLGLSHPWTCFSHVAKNKSGPGIWLALFWSPAPSLNSAHVPCSTLS